jgi:hypothetical protein
MARRKKNKKQPVKFSRTLMDAAKEAGFSQRQIDKFTDPEALKAMVIRAKPGLAGRFVEKPPPPAPGAIEASRVEASHQFECSVMAGFGPRKDRARKEQEQIDREVLRRSIRNIESMTIERSMKANDKGRFVSVVSVRYFTEG